MRLLGQYQTFLFFLQKDFTRTKSTKTDISEQKQKRQRFKCAYKTSKGRKVACSLICVFMLFMCFLCFLCVWNLFVKKKKKRFEIALMTSFTLLLKLFFSWVSLNRRTTDPTNRPPSTYPATHRLPTQWLTEPIIIFGRLDNRT